MLLVGTVLWLIAPQAFAASTSSDTGGWVEHFMGEDGSVSRAPEGGMQSTADLANLLIQPVLVAGSAPTVTSSRAAAQAIHGQGLQVATRFLLTVQPQVVATTGAAHVPVVLISLRPQGP